MTNLTSNRSLGRWVGSDHYYSLNANDQPDFQQKMGSMCGKWSLVFSERRWPTWLPTEAGVDVLEGIITILWTSMTNLTSNRSWGRCVGSDHYYSLNADDQPDFQQMLRSMGGKWSLLFSERRWPTWLPTEAEVDVWEEIISILWTQTTNPTSNRSCGRWVKSDHYYSLNADDKPDFKQKLGSMGGKWSLLFSERRWQTWHQTEAEVNGWEVIFIILWTPMTNMTSNKSWVDGWEEIISFIWPTMTNLTSDRSWGRCEGRDHKYSLNADDKPDFQQKLGSMGGKWSLLFSERRWPTWLPTEAGVNGWEVIINIL